MCKNQQGPDQAWFMVMVEFQMSLEAPTNFKEEKDMVSVLLLIRSLFFSVGNGLGRGKSARYKKS